MADHGRAADHKGKGKELATTSSPSTSTYNVHFVRLALQRVGGRTNLTHRDTFYRTLASMHAYKGRKFKIPIHQEGHLDLHRLLLEVISRGGMRKVEKEGLLEEVRDIISPSISVCYMLDLYHWFLLHYCEDFITENSQNTDASQPSSTQRTQLAHGGLEPWRPAISNPVTYDEEFRSNSHSTDPPMRLPDRSSPLWGMADELLTQAQTTVSQQRERNIRSALPPSSNYFAQSISSARPVAVQGAKTQAVSPQQRELNVSLSQLSSSTERSQNYADRLQNLPPTGKCQELTAHSLRCVMELFFKLLILFFFLQLNTRYPCIRIQPSLVHV